MALHGEAQWNGVAILSRAGLDDVVAGIAGAPGFPQPEARAVAATCGGIRVYSVYVPNGREPGLRALPLQARLAGGAAGARRRAGPRERDGVRRHEHRPGRRRRVRPGRLRRPDPRHPPERAALAELQALGLRDVVRDRWPDERVFTYWDYRAGMFHQDLGMRIDLVLASEPVAGRVRAAWVDRQARKGTGPSDHAPVIVDLDEAPDGDIGPVVPPPSARPRRRARPGCRSPERARRRGRALAEGAERATGMPEWSDADDRIIGGDLTAALAYLTPAEGAVVTPVAPIGLRDRTAGTVTFTTSLGFGRKLEAIERNPRVALAYHAREHGFAAEPRFVLVQGTASYDTDPDPALLLKRVAPASARFMGPPRRGVFWDRWLSAYYGDRVLVTVRVERVVSWPDSRAGGEAVVVGAPLAPDAPPSQPAPSRGIGPRVDVQRAARRVRALPHGSSATAGATASRSSCR